MARCTLKELDVARRGLFAEAACCGKPAPRGQPRARQGMEAYLTMMAVACLRGAAF